MINRTFLPPAQPLVSWPPFLLSSLLPFSTTLTASLALPSLLLQPERPILYRNDPVSKASSSYQFNPPRENTHWAYQTWPVPWAWRQSHQTPFASHICVPSSSFEARGCISETAPRLLAWATMWKPDLLRKRWLRCFNVSCLISLCINILLSHLPTKHLGQ